MRAINKLIDLEIKEIGGHLCTHWLSHRYARAGQRLWIMPYFHFSDYRGWTKGAGTFTIEFGWLWWDGQLWTKRVDRRIKRYGPLKNAPYPNEETIEQAQKRQAN